MAVCWVILRRQQMHTVIQAVHSLLYIVAKCNIFTVVIWKDIIKYLQKCEGCTHFCEILQTHTHTNTHSYVFNIFFYYICNYLILLKVICWWGMGAFSFPLLVKMEHLSIRCFTLKYFRTFMKVHGGIWHGASVSCWQVTVGPVQVGL